MKVQLKEGKSLVITREGRDLRPGQVYDFPTVPDDVLDLVGEFVDMEEDHDLEAEVPAPKSVIEEPVEEQPVLETE